MRSNFYISIGVWIILIPFLGLPIVAKNILMVLSGFVLIGSSLLPIIFEDLKNKSDKNLNK